MAFIKQFGRPESDQGEWQKIGNDTDTGEEVFLRIRRIPPSVVQQIESKFGYEKDVQVEVEVEGRKNSAFVRQRIHSGEDIVAIVKQKAIFAWTDSRGFKARPLDEEAAARYTKLLGVTVEVGGDVVVDGRANPEIKHYILQDDHSLASRIVEIAIEQGKKEYSKEAALSKA